MKVLGDGVSDIGGFSLLEMPTKGADEVGQSICFEHCSDKHIFNTNKKTQGEM
jgi:hypothetical protein